LDLFSHNRWSEYLVAGQYHRTLSRKQQGAIVSPILSNIYLHRFDRYVEQEVLPAWTRGSQRHHPPPYVRLAKHIRRGKQPGQTTAVKAWYQHLGPLPSLDPHDPTYRRLRYLRYADNWLTGFAGPKADAEHIKQTMTDWLQTNLNLALSEEKTLRSVGGGWKRASAHLASRLPDQVHRLKLIKRSIYGRAKFDLLRLRAFQAA
jgi:hypothetical protein